MVLPFFVVLSTDVASLKINMKGG